MMAIHENDKQNQRKHRKMQRRLQKGKISLLTSWVKKNAPHLLEKPE